MPGNNLFEYAVIRLVPRPEREEFINVGVIVYCAGKDFLAMKYDLSDQKLNAICPSMDCSELKQHLEAFEQICNGTSTGSPIARLDKPSRFRWLTATRSTIVQTSKVHPGLCDDPADTLQRLYTQLVL